MRRAMLSDATDLDSFLQSLKMVITFSPFDATGRERISQLINKSNQFNLTTRRYTALEVARLEATPDVFTLQIRLADRFGDNGMICVVICRRASDIWNIDTWLMSCRVLGRRVELATLQEVARNARLAGVAALRGHYVPTARNAMVKDHYAKLGFSKVAEDATGASEWLLELSDFKEIELPMEILRPEGGHASDSALMPGEAPVGNDRCA
jgi:FkbH-like protein